MLFLEILNFYWGYNNAFQFFFSLSVLGFDYYLVANNTSAFQMLVPVKCNGMLFTKKRLVGLTLKMVSVYS